jgi:hypothetical protein
MIFMVTLTLLLTNCMTWSNKPDLSEAQFINLHNGNKISYLMDVERIHVNELTMIVANLLLLLNRLYCSSSP